MFCGKFAWNWHSGSGEEDKNEKKIQTNRQTMDDGQSEKVTSSFSSGELTGRESNFLLLFKIQGTFFKHLICTVTEYAHISDITVNLWICLTANDLILFNYAKKTNFFPI